MHRARGRGAARPGCGGARAGRPRAARSRSAGGRRAHRGGDRRRTAAGPQPLHLLFLPGRAGARGAPPGGGRPQRRQAARGHRRGRGARVPLHRAVERPRPPHPDFGRVPAVQFSSLATRLHRAVYHTRPVAGRDPTGAVPGDPRLSAPRSSVRQNHRVISRNLLVRISVAVPAIAATLAVLALGGWWLAGMLAILGVLGTREVYDLARRQGIEALEWVGFIAAALGPLATYWVKSYADWEPVVYAGAVWLIVVLVVATARGPDHHPLTAVSVTVLGPLYASALLAFIVAIRHGPHVDAHPRGSVALAVLPLAITWVCDTCAMAGGALVGGPKLAPVLSPRKTWAGAIAGVAGGLVTALVYGSVVLERVALRLSVGQLVTLGLVVAIVAQVGDVAESLFKREAGVKDSSSLIPGHGGVLDRLDSLYFVLPVTAGLLRVFGLA